MMKVYTSEVIDPKKSHVVDGKDILNLNLIGTVDKVLEIKNNLEDLFFFICGSSNFHHLDVANLSRIQSKVDQEIQLILIDKHMDCFKFRLESNILHCGNWVSFAYQTQLINRVLMIGAQDESKYSDYDHSLIKNRDLLYHPDIKQTFDIDFLNPDSLIYISIDTDILSEPSDWGIGRYSMHDIVTSPIWRQLSKFTLIGASIMGHVTDNRKLLDLLESFIKMRKKCKNDYQKNENLDFFKKAVQTKLPASLTTRPLSINKQFEIIQLFYQKIQDIRGL